MPKVTKALKATKVTLVPKVLKVIPVLKVPKVIPAQLVQPATMVSQLKLKLHVMMLKVKPLSLLETWIKMAKSSIPLLKL